MWECGWKRDEMRKSREECAKTEGRSSRGEASVEGRKKRYLYILKSRKIDRTGEGKGN
jgi:hypothetical protein